MLTLPLVAASLMGSALAAPANQARAAGGIALPLSSRKDQHGALERRATTGSSSFSIWQRSIHYTTIEVGTPPQSIPVAVNALQNSSLTLYEGGAVPERPGSGFHPGNSSTFKTTNQHISSNGRLDSDVVSIGDLSFPELPFLGTNSTNAAASSSVMRQSGILSIGFDAGNGGDPIWKRVVDQGGEPQAGIYFERTYFDGFRWSGGPLLQENAGEMMLGGINSKYYQGDINYLDIIEGIGGGIAVRLEGLKLNGKAVEATNDTVTSWVPKPSGGGNETYDASVPGPISLGFAGPQSNLGNATFHALHAKIPGAEIEELERPSSPYPYKVQAAHVPCDTNVSLSLTFNGTEYVLRPQDWIWNGSNTGEKCNSMFMSVETQPPYIGLSFLQSVYTVFQYDKKQIGFARLADGLPTRNVSVNGTATVDVPGATATSAAEARHPASAAVVLAALTLAAASLVA